MGKQNYEIRIQRVIEYVYANIEGDLSLDELADVAAMSRFHWSRVWRAVMGEPITGTVRRLRLQRAAALLVHGRDPVGHIAAQVGYPDKASFARGFAAHFGMSPSDFRKTGQLSDFQLPRNGDIEMQKVDLVENDALTLIGQGHVGNYFEISQTYERVFGSINARGLFPQVTGTYGVYFDDPQSVLEAELRSFAGVSLADGATEIEGMEVFEIPAGPFARLEYKGPYTGLRASYDYLFGVWLPASGREPAETPCVEHYLNSPMDTAPGDLVTHIYLALKPAA